MAAVEITTFRLADRVREDDFLALDRRLQTELVPNRAGFVRRTTARRDGGWLVVTLWASEAHAAAFDEETVGHELRRAFAAQVDGASLATARYDTLD